METPRTNRDLENRNSVRFELIDKDGNKAPMTFGTAAAAANHALMMWPDQEQDEDRTGRGWDIQVNSHYS